MGTVTERLHSIRHLIETLPPVSPYTVRITRQASDPKCSARELAMLVSLDMSLSAACLKMVNSTAFGLRKQVSSIEQAVAFLGSREIMNMAISGGLRNVFDRPLKGYFGDSGDLWAHSLRTAVASSLAADALFPGGRLEAAYTAGLLHDIGKVVLSEFLGVCSGEVVTVLEGTREEDFPLIEKRFLRMDHAEAGALLARQWNFPAPIEAVIRNHHTPGEAPEAYRALCLAVHIGDILSMLGGYGTGCDTLAYRIDPLAENVFRRSDGAAVRLMLIIEDEYARSREKLSVLEGENHV